MPSKYKNMKMHKTYLAPQSYCYSVSLLTNIMGPSKDVQGGPPATNQEPQGAAPARTLYM